MAQWYIMLNGEQAGPTDASHLGELVSTGRLQPTDMVWSEGMAAWQPAGSVPELAPLFSGQPVGAPGYSQFAGPLPNSGSAVASLVLGIISIPTCILWGIPSLVCGILAIVYGGLGKSAVADGRAGGSSAGMATAGKICGIVGICLSVLFWVLAVAIYLRAPNYPNRFRY